MLTQPIEPNADKQCHACATRLIARACFCRRCGVRQLDGNTASANLTYLAECETRPLTADTQEFQSYSGQLIKFVTQNLSSRTVPLNPSRGLQRLVCTLITLPIWMLIVLAKQDLRQSVMIDCSHGNSEKDHRRQGAVAADVCQQIAGGSWHVFGIMLESHLVEGRQDYVPGRDAVYGQSITDACLSFDDTVPVLESLAAAVRRRRSQ